LDETFKLKLKETSRSSSYRKLLVHFLVKFRPLNMRLINTSSLELKEFIGGDAPEYAILSHTWDEEEITLHELQHPTPQTHQKKGFKKVFRFCEIANQDGYTWVWCDTCCIDKTSSAELSEAINSMFTWYKCSHVCYAFLSDVRRNQSEKGTFGPNAWRQWEKSLNNSKWFRRGWTLQELIAPTVLRFYDADWTCIASKDAIAGAIADITEIDVGVFLHGFYPTNYTVATRMSWAAKRRTTRVEDIAYCLLGLFNVNMPLLYGEGTRAFRRLQEEILKHEEDLTLLAWTDKAIMGTVLPVLRDPLANSPSDFDPSANPDSEFQDYSQLVPLRDDTAPTKMHRRLVALAKTIDQPYAMTPKGIFLAVLISKKRVKRDPLLRSGFSILAFLNCFVRSSGKLVCLLLHGEYIDEAEALLKASVSTPSIRLVAPSSGFRPGKVYVSAPYGAEGNLMRLLPRAGRPPYALNLRPIFILQSNQRSIHSVNPGLFLPVLVEFNLAPSVRNEI
jgi:hypothetical protein